MSEQEINREPVEYGQLQWLFYEGEAYGMPKGSNTCPVLSRPSIQKAIYQIGYGQLTLFGEGGIVGESQDSHNAIEKRRKEFSRRLAGCVSGECMFIEQTPSCWRRTQAESPLDEMAQK